MLDTRCSLDVSSMGHHSDASWLTRCTVRLALAILSDRHLGTGRRRWADEDRTELMEIQASSSSVTYRTEGAELRSEDFLADHLGSVPDDPSWTTPFWTGYRPLTGHIDPLRNSSDVYSGWFDDEIGVGGLGVPRNRSYHPRPPPSSSAPSTNAPTPCLALDVPEPFNALPTSSRHSPVDSLAYPRRSPAKRSRDEDSSPAESVPSAKNRRTSRLVPTPEMNEEERLLIQLKDEGYLSWKDIASRFQSDLGKTYQVPALQMRFKRLREKTRPWTETDIQTLQQAHDFWMRSRWDVISSKMAELTSDEKWPPRYCARKWEELHPGQDPSKDIVSSHSSDNESDEESLMQYPPAQASRPDPFRPIQ